MEFNSITFIAGITQVARMTGLPSKYLPLFAVLLGALIHPLLMETIAPEAILYGAFIGCSVTGIINLLDTKITKYTTKTATTRSTRAKITKL